MHQLSLAAAAPVTVASPGHHASGLLAADAGGPDMLAAVAIVGLAMLLGGIYGLSFEPASGD